VGAAGLQMELGCYFYAALLPLVAAARLLDRWRRDDEPPRSHMQRFGRFTNAALDAVCRAELTLFRANRIAGLSVFGLAVKP